MESKVANTNLILKLIHKNYNEIILQNIVDNRFSFVEFFLCVKLSLSDPQDILPPEEPGEFITDSLKAVVIKIDWENITGDNPPDNLYLNIDTTNLLVSRGEQPDTVYCKKGNYTLLVRNNPYGFIFDEGLASINMIGDYL